jgi:hypothetical protein
VAGDDGEEVDEGMAPEPAAAGETRAWGCGLVAGVAFAGFFGAGWLAMMAPQPCVEGFPCAAYAHWRGMAALAPVAVVSGLYGLGVRRMLRQPPRRPPLWAALTGLTLFASSIGGGLMWLVMVLATT